MIILNDRLTFQGANNTSVELQLNETKNNGRIYLGYLLSPCKWGWDTFIKTATMPVLTAIECALNKYLLLEKEKSLLYFVFRIMSRQEL